MLAQLAVVPIMVGVIMACYGDMGTFGVMGVAVTVFCVVMSGMKNVLSGEMLTGDIKVSPLRPRVLRVRRSISGHLRHRCRGLFRRVCF